jgi:hypothetical protein
MEYIDRVIALAGGLGCVVQTPEEAGFISNSKPQLTAWDDTWEPWLIWRVGCGTGRRR